jgi:hypothetical protein
VEGQIEGNEEIGVGMRAVLREWFNAVKSHPAKHWRIGLKAAGCEPGYGRDRCLTIFSSEAELKTFKHQWNSDTRHDYATIQQIEFEWHPDDAFGLVLQRVKTVLGVSTGAEDIIATNGKEKPIRGPLAVWYANYLGKTESENGWLEFEIVDCPGPPPEVFPERQVQAVTSKIR